MVRHINYVFSSAETNVSRQRFFIEAGACDGELISNTLHLEINYNWTGLLVEPNPIFISALVKKMRNVWIFPHCLSLSTSPMVVDFDAFSEFGGVINKDIGKPANIILNKPADWPGSLHRKTVKVSQIQ